LRIKLRKENMKGEPPMSISNEELAKKIADLEAELTALKAQVKPEEKKPFIPKPFPKYDPTEGFRLPASAVAAMVDVVPDMRAIAQEQKHRGEPGGFGSGKSAVSEIGERGSGWSKPVPDGLPPGIKYIDQMVDVQDGLDRRERMRGFVRRI
jgi:hypothetical protein